jgi:hypothetical protein
MRSSNFDSVNGKIIELVNDGETLADACERVGLPYATARGWISEGRRNPEGHRGGFVRAIDAARNGSSSNGLHHDDEEGHEPGPVERGVCALIAGRALDANGHIAAVQGRALARQIDLLSAKGTGSAALGMAAASRRLDDVIASLKLQPEDEVTGIGRAYIERHAKMQAALDGNGAVSGA